MFLFLRPKDDFSWIVPGYINPYENAFFAVHGYSPVIYLEDIQENPHLLNRVNKILAFSAIPILQLGQEIWDLVVSYCIPVYGNSFTSTILSLFLNPKTLTIPEDEYLSVAETENIPFNQFRSDVVTKYSSLLRNSFVFQEYIVFKVLEMNFMSIIPENVSIISENGWSQNRKYFFGDLSFFRSSFLENVLDYSRGISHINAYIAVRDKQNIDEILEEYFSVMDNVKKSLRLTLTFYSDGLLLNLPGIDYLRKYKLKGVKVVIADDFHFGVKTHLNSLITDGKFLNSSFINKTKILRG
jgi:hypothetical protein